MTRLHACVVFVGARDPAVCSDRMGFCEDRDCWCSCPGIPATDPDHWLVGVCAVKNQYI